MNFLKRLFTAKPQDVEKAAVSSLPAPEKLGKLLKFTEHEDAEVRIAAIRWLRPDSLAAGDGSEEQIVARLGQIVVADPDQRVRAVACERVIGLIRESQSFGQVAGKHPMAIQAIVSQLNSSAETAEATVSSLRMGTPDFHRMLRHGPHSDELIAALGRYAKGDAGEERNGATIILGRLKDERAQGLLESLADDSDVYVKTNARQSLQQIEPADGFFSFSLDGWKVERYSGFKMNEFAKTTFFQAAGGGAGKSRLIYAFDLIPPEGASGNWGVSGTWPCPRCGGSISFQMSDLLKAEEVASKGSCHPRQDYSIVARHRGRERDGALSVPVLIYTDGEDLSGDYLLHFTYFQKFAG